MPAGAPTLLAGRVAVVLGTRPEIIKLGPLVQTLGSDASVVHTGQHFDAGLSQVFFDAFGLAPPDAHLGVGGSTRGVQIGRAVAALDELFASERPRAVVVQGDTNSALAGAIAANAREIPLVHVEAGLRSFDRRMPEEHNRVLADHLADLCCAPTEVNERNLRAEGIPDERILVTGNTIVEAVLSLLPEPEERARLLDSHGLTPSGFVLSTFHRPENVDDPDRLSTILHALSDLPLPVLLPLHPRTVDRLTRHGMTVPPGVVVTEPIGYPEFLGLAQEAAVLVSDSGGIQEESSIVKRPVLVVRRSTERPEVLGTFAERREPGDDIAGVVSGWIDDLAAIHRRLAGIPSPYGDGSASRAIAAAIGERFPG